MKLRFSIHYRAEWGQQLSIALRYRSQDRTERTVELPMTTQDGDSWTAETAVVESRRSPVVSFTYSYSVSDGEGRALRREWSAVPRTYCFDSSKTYVLADQWHDLPLASHLYTSAYAVTTGQSVDEPLQPLPLPLFRKTLLFRVSAPQLMPGQRVALVGSHPALGSWSPARYLAMQYAGQKEWMLSVNADALALPLEYKYVVVDEATHQLLSWEEGDNRLTPEACGEGEVQVLYGDGLRLAEKTWRAAGVSVPVFSLRSDHSFGVGDFGDLLRFIDWAAMTGMKVVQLLPLNDTTSNHGWGDSYPYNIVSAFALHPHYIDLEQLGSLKDKKRMTAYRRRQRELNSLPLSDYEAVDRVKGEYLRELFLQQGAADLANEACRSWATANRDWLEPYAAWLSQPLDLTTYIQYHLHLQLKRAADHARSKGIVLKGDLPIGVNRTSVETSVHPDFFHLDSQTGAPPDAFTQQGQNWGFPTYRWESEGLRDWFHRRLRHMEQYFDALRIDHVLGFFRIWEIPEEQLFGTMGHFSPSLPLSPEEIEYFGLTFRHDLLTKPFINDAIVDRLFGLHAQYVRDTFLTRKAYGLYELNDEVNTQRKVCSMFDGRTDENSLWSRDGLYRLVANVLFLEDPQQQGMYHPRIAAWQEPAFDCLNNEERDAYMRIYNNYFFQRHSMFWGQTGIDRLGDVFGETRMLLCAEDLGMLPDCVEPVLDALRILTLEIQQLPKQNGVEFSHLDGNPIRSVTTISTHDMAPLRLWWEQQAERRQRYWSTMLQKQGRAPQELPAHIAEEVIARHLYSPSMLCVLSLQDWLAMDGSLRSSHPGEERINVPSDPYNRWQWRMHLTVEQLMQAERFNGKLKTMIERSKRG